MLIRPQLLSQQTQNVTTMLVYCCSIVNDVGPALNQHLPLAGIVSFIIFYFSNDCALSKTKARWWLQTHTNESMTRNEAQPSL